MRPAYALALVLVCSASPMSGATQDTTPLRLIQTVPLPGVEGRIDHMAYDSTDRRLFVCALGNSTVEIIDLRKGARVHSITGLGSPQDVGYIPDFDRIFVANDQGGICKIYDGKSYRQLSEVDLKNDADNVRYDRATKQIYVGFGAGGLSVINAANGKQVNSITLSAHPEAFQLEKNGHRLFVNVPASRHIAVIDRAQKTVITTWSTDSASANFPMSLDETHRRLFVGCRLPGKLLVINTESGAVIAEVELCGDCDDIFYDGKRQRIYATCGAGKIDVIEQLDPNTYKKFVQIDSASGARTGLFVPELDILFVAVPHRAFRAAEIRAYQVGP